MGFNCAPAPGTGYLEHVGLLRAAGMGLSFAVPAIRSKHWVLAAALLVAGVGAFLWLGSGPAGPPPPASVLGIDEASLPGVPRSLLPSLQTARLGGRRALREWMRQNEKRCLDPLLAWIQLEYAVLARDSKPDEAKVYFEMVKSRTGTNSPIIRRIVQLDPYFR